MVLFRLEKESERELPLAMVGQSLTVLPKVPLHSEMVLLREQNQLLWEQQMVFCRSGKESSLVSRVWGVASVALLKERNHPNLIERKDQVKRNKSQRTIKDWLLQIVRTCRFYNLVSTKNYF